MTEQRAGEIPQFTRGDRLRKAREKTGLDRGQFATEIGVSRNSVSSAESDAHNTLKVTVMAWALRTKVDYEWLETGIEPSPGHGPGGGLRGSGMDSDGYLALLPATAA